MAVAGMLTELEERLGILIEDDEVDGEMLGPSARWSAFGRRQGEPVKVLPAERPAMIGPAGAKRCYASALPPGRS